MVTTFSEKNVTLLAAGIAYNALVSLAPLLLLLLFVVSLVGGGLEDRLVSAADGSLPGPIADVVGQIFTGSATATGASLVGLVVLVWGTLKVFRGLDTAFSVIYETEGRNSFVDQLVDGVVVLFALILAIVMTVAVNALFVRFAEAIPALRYLAPLVLVLGLVVAFLPIYYRFPDLDLEWAAVLPGTIFAAVGWAALQSVFQVYLAFSGGSSQSFFGGVLVVVTWLYFSGLVLLLGAVLNAVMSPRPAGEDREPRPDDKPQVTETTAHRTLDRAELAQYLDAWRARFTTDAAAADHAATTARDDPDVADPSSNDAALLPTGDESHVPAGEQVEVVERTGGADDGQINSITFRWVDPDGEGGPATGSDEQGRH